MTVQVSSPGYHTVQLAQLDRFVTHIKKICEVPGLRAGLRRGVGHRPDTAHRSHAYVAGWVRPDDGGALGGAYEAREWAYYAVAAMIAAQPGKARRDDPDGELPDDGGVAGEASGAAVVVRRRANLGVALAQAVTRDAGGKRVIAQDSAEKRLHLLTRQGLAGVHRHLPATVRHLRAANVSIDWAMLILDLSRWSNARDQVAKEWLQAFYRTVTTQPNDSTIPGSADS